MTDVESLHPPVGKPGRHRWGDPVRFPYKTERSCIMPGCGIVKVTRHEPGEHPWLEFYRGGERIQCERTPECKGEPSIPSLDRPAEAVRCVGAGTAEVSVDIRLPIVGVIE